MMGWYTCKCGSPMRDGTCCCSYCEGYADGTEKAEAALARVLAECDRIQSERHAIPENEAGSRVRSRVMGANGAADRIRAAALGEPKP